MDGIEKITDRIIGDTQREIEEIDAAARRQAAEIEASYKARAEQIKEAALARGNRAADERREQLAGAARLELKKRLLGVRQEMLDEAFKRALICLTQMPEEEYVDYLVRLAVAASSRGREQLILSQRDRTRLGKKVVTEANQRLEQAGKPAALTLSQESRAMKGGLILCDGDIEVNCTFEMTLQLLRKKISGEVAKLLFS